MRWLAGIAVVVIGCGRVHFEPRVFVDAVGEGDTGLIQGLIHHWPLDEAPGDTIAHDIIGGADATLTAPAAFTTVAQVGSGALASNTGGFAFVSMPSDLVGTSTLTMSAWFQRNAVNGKEQLGQELAPLNVANNHELSIQFWDDGLIYVCVGDTAPCGTVSSNDMAWHFVELVFDGTQTSDATRLALYLDRTRRVLTFTSPPAVPATTPTVLGNHFDLGAVTDNEGQDAGSIDDVRIYDHALDASEIAALP